MGEWIDRLADELGCDRLSSEETGRLLRISREVAHRVERKDTPLAAFLIGETVAARTAAGASRPQAFEATLGQVSRLLPDAPAEASTEPEP